ncbi:hypothetical protein QBC36DRAFT_336721 [Triangularia setosa]|uniref:Epidermal growth factor receptor-like transmembrane-juxtamembrane segment domain-containing protein n=1 Tax=Triangularia setosa TaxID=2587417 RepID=A0AAN7A4K3_9PEZI|nr:hypothetical protein QBC36DRAFT_336721 [Podospora setosa]
MHVASRLSPESTPCSDLSHTTRVVRALRPAPTTTTLVIPLSECCESRTPPIDFAPRATLSTTVASSVTSGVRGPSNTSPSSPSPPTTVGGLPGFAIAGIVAGVLLVLAGAAFIFFICRRRKQRRRNSGAAKESAMYQYPEYQTVPVNQPRSPPSHSPSNSSVTTEALLDLGLYESDDANEYTCGPITPPQPQYVEHEMVQIRKATPSPRAVDRRSVDTVFALWFYATTELDRRRSKGSSHLAELPSSTPSPPVPALPISPSPPVPDQTRTKRSSKAPKAYLTPAGEPWRPGPPPAAPLPPPPPPVSAPSTSPAPRKPSNPRFSLFPAPPKPPPKNIMKNINSSRSPIPAPLMITPLTNHPLRNHRSEQQQPPQSDSRQGAASTGIKSAPLPSNKPLPLSPPLQPQPQSHQRPRAQSSQSRLGPGVGLGLQTEGMVDVPLINTNSSPTSRRPGTSLSAYRFACGRQQQETTTRPETSLGTTQRPQTPGTAPATSTRFNEGLLTPPMGGGQFAPPPGAGHKTRRSLPGTSGSRWLFSGFGGWRSPKYIS